MEIRKQTKNERVKATLKALRYYRDKGEVPRGCAYGSGLEHEGMPDDEVLASYCRYVATYTGGCEDPGEIKTGLPLFPGFYETGFEASEYELHDAMVEVVLQHMFNDAEHPAGAAFERAGTGMDIWRYVDYDCGPWEAEVCEQCVDIINDKLATGFTAENNPGMTYRFEKIDHPREYNFYNDQCDVVFSVANQDRYIQWVYLTVFDKDAPLRESFESHIARVMRPRDGFIPYYSMDIHDWCAAFLLGELGYAQHKMVMAHILEEHYGLDASGLHASIGYPDLKVYLTPRKDKLPDRSRIAEFVSYYHEVENKLETYLQAAKTTEAGLRQRAEARKQKYEAFRRLMQNGRIGDA